MHRTQLANVDGTGEFPRVSLVQVHSVVTLTCTYMPSQSEGLPS